jgi:ceramide glucosyltransferase
MIPSLPDMLGLASAVLALAGIGQAVAGAMAVRRFCGESQSAGTVLPPVTLLKPLYGDEPLLEQALESVIGQDYPAFQIVFGVQDPKDAAIDVVHRLRLRHPEADITLVIDSTQHGLNRKIGNVINMLPRAMHDVLVIADSDLHCAPDYLRQVVAGFALPKTGLVTTLYAGLAANRSVTARLGASAINHGFLPGALMSRGMGRQDCLGATMALRRETLTAIGGLEALVDHLADDNVLGQKVRARGLGVTLACTVPATTVPEDSIGALFRHELRWSRTILSLVPVAFAASAIQFPIAWALLCAALTQQPWALGLVGLTWLARAATAGMIDSALGLVRVGRATKAPIWLLPLRDLLSIAIILASYASDKVEWRGQMMHTRPNSPPPPETDAPSASQGTVLS